MKSILNINGTKKYSNWKNYESITKYIFEILRKEFNINTEGYRSDCKVKSNVFHLIDVLTSESNDARSHRTAIECRYLNKGINKDMVIKL